MKNYNTMNALHPSTQSLILLFGHTNIARHKKKRETI